MGSSCHCREAFAAWLPAYGVPLSYAVAIGYVLVDTADKGSKAYANAKKELDSKASLHPEVDTPRYGKRLYDECMSPLDLLFDPPKLASRSCLFFTMESFLCPS